MTIAVSRLTANSWKLYMDCSWEALPGQCLTTQEGWICRIGQHCFQLNLYTAYLAKYKLYHSPTDLVLIYLLKLNTT